MLLLSIYFSYIKVLGLQAKANLVCMDIYVLCVKYTETEDNADVEVVRRGPRA